MSGSQTHDLIAQSIRTSEWNSEFSDSVVLGSNPTQVNFL